MWGREMDIETSDDWVDKLDEYKKLRQECEDAELQYEIDDLKRIENYQSGKLVLTLNLLIAAMGIALVATGLAIMNGKGFAPWQETFLVFSEQFALISLILLVVARFGAWIWFTHVQFKKADEFALRKKRLKTRIDVILGGSNPGNKR